MKLDENFIDNINFLYEEKGAKRILSAIDFASLKLQGIKRDSGEESICHSIRIAELLADSKADEDTVVCGILHDLLEDTDTEEKEISDRFGETVLNILKGLAKLEMVKSAYYANSGEIDNLRKMLLAMGGDARVAFVKLADRLDNLQTLSVKESAVQFKIARLTMDLYVPIAERLGMNIFKKQMEDICFRYLYPDDYTEVYKFLNDYYAKSESTINKITEEIVALTKEHKIEARVQSRRKSGYSIFKKWQVKGKENVYDIFALRVIVRDIKDCYAILGAINNAYEPVPGRMKDYIASPKKNLYMSLHTTVLYEKDNVKVPFEVQIRTEEMHNYCEYGLAAHWIYKESGVNSIGTGNALKNLRKTLTKSSELMQIEGNAEQFLQNIKNGFYENQIFVFTPSLNVIELPKGSIPIDFAYSIHSSLGNRCVGAKVNGKMVPLTTSLKTGDLVEVITSSSAKGPSRDWLKKVKSREASSKIKAFFKKERREENIKIGRSILEDYAKQNGFSLSRLLEEKEIISEIQKHYHLSSIDDWYVVVGYGGLTSTQLLGKIVSKLKAEAKKNNKAEALKVGAKKEGGVVVGGQRGLLKRFAKCCNPIPGDEIVGYVSRGEGVTIHRHDCKSLKKLDADRTIEAYWADESSDQVYDASFKVVAKNTVGVLSEISAKIADNKIDITFVSSEKAKDIEDSVISIGVKIKSRKQLDDIMNKIQSISSVYEIFR